MPAVQEPNSGLNWGWDLGESEWKTGVDANWLMLGRVLTQAGVLDKDLATPPGAPANGDRYIVAAAATDAWLGQENNVAVWDGAAWVFYAPKEGWKVWVADEDATYVFDGAEWKLEASIAYPAESNEAPAGSPHSYKNESGRNQDVIVAGGTVTLIEWSRDDGTTWYDVGVVAGMFRLSPGDTIRVTYSAAPTITLIPR